ncbi:hypothetical protein BDM02DRAFT_3183112 [Thelephora ganbajun]|uniref:Uncharacterized protein n=1 Tax=Thelephora ganbajun TaxID=370292 RepID=A0ACB6ZUP8_THEGA|nr:hypothetical protein BDM02DRAFT_3183112 [Thelephora ganbajun]
MSVRKLMRMNRTSSCFTSKGSGVRVRRDSTHLNYGHIKQNCLIEIADYSNVRSSFGRMTNQELIDFVNSPKASERKPWYGRFTSDSCVPSSRSCVPDVHPLSLEDVLHVSGRPRSGADYYKRHIFIRVLSYTLNQNGQNEAKFLNQIPRLSSPEIFRFADEIEGFSEYPTETHSSGLTPKLSRRFKSPHRSATIEPGDCDIENADASSPSRTVIPATVARPKGADKLKQA